MVKESLQDSAKVANVEGSQLIKRTPILDTPLSLIEDSEQGTSFLVLGKWMIKNPCTYENAMLFATSVDFEILVGVIYAITSTLKNSEEDE